MLEATLKAKTSSMPLRNSHVSYDSEKLSEIYNENVNISIWKRKLNAALELAADEILNNNPELNLSMVPQPHHVKDLLPVSYTHLTLPTICSV